jgi:hypothetical protein
MSVDPINLVLRGGPIRYPVCAMVSFNFCMDLANIT